jgi:hypothetical protein
MGIVRNFEQRLEKALEGTFSRVFKVGVHPIEIAKRISRELEEGKSITSKETLAPNLYEIHLSKADYQRFADLKPVLVAELESLVLEQTQKEGYILLTRPVILFREEEDLVEGEFDVKCRISPSLPQKLPATGESPPGVKPIETPGVLTITKGPDAGLSRELQNLPFKIGRSEDNDLVINDPLVSRYHAVIEKRGHDYQIRDLKSTNGTFVGGRRIEERLLEDGDVIQMGDTALRFHFKC